ncbi:FAD-dependent oxidoreductase [Fictibacillus aquaticus]|uniref:FAD-linked oxidase n=1 Tax=Fictibacillus aquaticus TaxID=2021314 RepID=A0A235F5Q0_9BACL|nr:FAD-binding oxidoreductase [Fictibacillus aquaticus]OYD56569.1 FAD-linked oxidase [Fictibacillus aquaticus]
MSEDLKGLTGEIVTPEDPRYEQARQEWNRAIQKFPLVIVYCLEIKDVQNAIRWARKNKAEIRIRSGGHHYEGYSVGNGVLVIDISRLTRIDMHEGQRLVKIQSGVKNKELYEALGSRGYPFPGGTCPTVGVCGYVLGGGWGMSTRLFGLGSDQLLEIEIVNYKGKLLTCSEEKNKDLFWALRGAGGGNFGVVVSMTFRLPPKVDKVSLVQVYAPESSKAQQESFLTVWQEWLKKLDIRMTINVSIYNSEEEGLGIFGRGLFYGDTETASKLLQPFADIGLQITVRHLTFLEAVTAVMNDYPPFEKFQSTGRFVHRDFDNKEIRKIAGTIQKPADGSVFTAVTVYALGGRVSEISRKESAFYFRDARYIMGIQTVWTDDAFEKVNQDWLYPRFQYIRSVTKGSFVNFPYDRLGNYEKAYYGGNAEKLRKINREYDPHNVFTFPQGIKG